MVQLNNMIKRLFVSIVLVMVLLSIVPGVFGELIGTQDKGEYSVLGSIETAITSGEIKEFKSSGDTADSSKSEIAKDDSFKLDNVVYTRIGDSNLYKSETGVHAYYESGSAAKPVRYGEKFNGYTVQDQAYYSPKEGEMKVVAEKNGVIYYVDTKVDGKSTITNTEPLLSEDKDGQNYKDAFTVASTKGASTLITESKGKGDISKVKDIKVTKEIDGTGVNYYSLENKYDSLGNIISSKEEVYSYVLPPDADTEKTTYTDANKKRVTQSETETTYKKKTNDDGKYIGADGKLLPDGASPIMELDTTVTIYHYYTVNEKGEQVETQKRVTTDANGKVTNTETGVAGKDGKVPKDGWSPDELATTKQKTRDILQDIEFSLTTFSGLSGYSKLFFDKESLENWRESVDSTFAKFYIGTEYWSSKLCSVYVDRVGSGVMLIETPSGLLEPSSHIEMERSPAIEYVNLTDEGSAVFITEYLYKLSFAVENPSNSNQNLDFNVVMRGSGAEVWLYKTYRKLEEGKSYSRIGSSMIVQYSTVLYDEVCIMFKDKIYLGSGESVSKLCVPVVESSTSNTGYVPEGSESTTTTGSEDSDTEADF